jgi:hypothetical protein
VADEVAVVQRMAFALGVSLKNLPDIFESCVAVISLEMRGGMRGEHKTCFGAVFLLQGLDMTSLLLIFSTPS